MAGNQLGKTLAGGAEWAMHLSGRYPDWWLRALDMLGIEGLGFSAISTRLSDVIVGAIIGDFNDIVGHRLHLNFARASILLPEREITR